MEKMKISRSFSAEKPRLFAGLLAAAFAATLLLIAGSFTSLSPNSPFLCSTSAVGGSDDGKSKDPTPPQLEAILHYATSRTVPQQSLAEISVSAAVLRSLGPCRFLVFGLGHDSLMWTGLNPRGTTLFLEEDPRWVHSILRRFPNLLRSRVVRYPTRLHQADSLLSSYKDEPDCLLGGSHGLARLKGNAKCKLALSTLPSEVYEDEWDVIMIDAPRGYFPEAPGRMAAIYTAAVMARGRTHHGVTHVFLHDVNRRVERVYAEEFLCKKYLVKAVGRLWHFEIPSFVGNGNFTSFC
ncbi:unnamed protein product [Linum tenue]|uniref:Polysaccharide biosynthesis domain-containing protein n=2 Tax=Linum tenue TaxID=586396 RepID=A0AAV0NHM8_9ROSI|nr:unnamed protein product [Linum tenue]